MSREDLHRQLIKLGDMMGDGLHYEDPSIAKEYRQVAKALYPNMYRRKKKPSQKFIKTLIPCSCGHTKWKLVTHTEGYLIYCPECSANCKGQIMPTKEDARDKWNELNSGFKKDIDQ